ncbi:hypothetical protein [Neolewinella agarilytica]|uniref:hypothetical protein n=1 Tax=Neolewinella agarilytica TaxID=478744 RepID=UPI002357A94C|nr:hypothetical protein [Neolewinella agarilytica]
MKLLQELAFVLNRYCVKNINVITPNQSGEGDLVNAFYNILQDEPDLDHELIAQRLYGSESTDKDNRFRKLKQRLTRRMANTLFFIDPKDNQFNEFQRAYYQTNRDYALSRILVGRDASTAGNHFMRKVYKRSSTYDFTELLMLSTDSLRSYYAYRSAEQEKYKFYREEYLRARKLYDMENDVRMAYEEVVINYGVSPKARKLSIELIDKRLEEIHEAYPVIEHTYRSIINYFALSILGHQLKGDAKGLLAIIDNGLEAVQQKPYPADIPKSFFYVNKVVVHIIEKDYPAGSETLAAAAPLLVPGFANWFKFKEMEFLLAMHTGHYTEALATYQSVANYKSVGSIPKRYQDRWLLNRAYLYYLASINRVEIPEGEDPWGKFRLGKFLNNVPAFSRDKKGMNIPILILQIAYSIVLKRYALTVDRIEAIEKYRSRHVRRDESFRSNLFIKILLQFPVVAFHRNGVRRKTERYAKQLKDNPIDLANQSFEVEVLPYETLFELALESLEVKFQRRAMAKKTDKRSASR